MEYAKVAICFVLYLPGCLMLGGSSGSAAPASTRSPSTSSSSTTCAVYQSVVDCTERSLEVVPYWIPSSVSHLHLDLNKLTGESIRHGIFNHLWRLIYLDLSFNQIQKLPVGAFYGLFNLEFLDLKGNPLFMRGLNFPFDVFSPLRSLTTLILDTPQNDCLDCTYPDVALAKLTNLETLVLPALNDFSLGEYFEVFRNLEYLTISCKYNNIRRLGSKAFRSIRATNIKHLTLRNCEMEHLDSYVFSGLELKTLNLACNKDLGLENIWTVLSNIPNGTLTTLVVDKVQSGLYFLKSSSIPYTLCKLERLSMRANYIVAVDVYFFLHLPLLEHINIGFNAPFTSATTSEILNVLSRAKWKTIDLSYFGHYASSPDFNCTFCKPDYITTEDFFQNQPSFLITTERHFSDHSIDWSHKGHTNLLKMNIPTSASYIFMTNVIGISLASSKNGLKIAKNNQIALINISGSEGFLMKGPFVNFHELQVLDASHCNMKNTSLHPKAFSHLQKLTHLFLQNNSLEGIPENQFHCLWNLKLLDLSHNGINFFTSKHFADLKHLETLLLTGNHLTSLQFLLALDMESFQFLDISNNNFHHLCDEDIGLLEDFRTLTVNLCNNPLLCNCPSINFIYWIQTQESVHFLNYQIYRCDFFGRLPCIKDVDVPYLHDTCNAYYKPVYFMKDVIQAILNSRIVKLIKILYTALSVLFDLTLKVL